MAITPRVCSGWPRFRLGLREEQIAGGILRSKLPPQLQMFNCGVHAAFLKQETAKGDLLACVVRACSDGFPERFLRFGEVRKGARFQRQLGAGI